MDGFPSSDDACPNPWIIDFEIYGRLEKGDDGDVTKCLLEVVAEIDLEGERVSVVKKGLYSALAILLL